MAMSAWRSVTAQAGVSAHMPALARSGPGAGAGAAGDAFDLGDIFCSVRPGFGNGRSYSRMRGRDIRFTLEIDFLDAINGAKRRVSLAEGRTLDVAIPAGVESGQVLRLKNQGGVGVQGGPAGDALVELTVRPHAFFRRDGQDVHMDLNISLTEAVEGGRVQAPTPSGAVTLTIPAGSNLERRPGSAKAWPGAIVCPAPGRAAGNRRRGAQEVHQEAERDYAPPRPQG
jgi:DnaJ-class molecular chaperone